MASSAFNLGTNISIDDCITISGSWYDKTGSVSMTLFNSSVYRNYIVFLATEAFRERTGTICSLVRDGNTVESYTCTGTSSNGTNTVIHKIRIDNCKKIEIVSNLAWVEYNEGLKSFQMSAIAVPI